MISYCKNDNYIEVSDLRRMMNSKEKETDAEPFIFSKLELDGVKLNG